MKSEVRTFLFARIRKYEDDYIWLKVLQFINQ